jgi:hypothetical protein
MRLLWAVVFGVEGSQMVPGAPIPYAIALGVSGWLFGSAMENRGAS